VPLHRPEVRLPALGLARATKNRGQEARMGPY
jgi:hypothetical protein